MHYAHTPQSTGSKLGPSRPAVEPLLLYLWDVCLTEPMGGHALTQVGHETFDNC